MFNSDDSDFEKVSFETPGDSIIIQENDGVINTNELLDTNYEGLFNEKKHNIY